MAGTRRKRSRAGTARTRLTPLRSLHFAELLPSLPGPAARYALGRVTGASCYLDRDAGRYVCAGLPDLTPESLAVELGQQPRHLRGAFADLEREGLLYRVPARRLWLPAFPRAILSDLLGWLDWDPEGAEAEAEAFLGGRPEPMRPLRSLHFEGGPRSLPGPAAVYVCGRVYGESMRVDRRGGLAGSGFCRLTPSGLASESGIALRSVRKALRDLEDRSLVWRPGPGPLRGTIFAAQPFSFFASALEPLGHRPVRVPNPDGTAGGGFIVKLTKEVKHVS